MDRQGTRVDPRILAGNDYGVSDREWTRVDWREHLGRVELPGASVNYVEIGEGAPLLFIHGVSGCWQNWLENLLPLAQRHRVIAPDLPGYGLTPMPSWPLSIERYADFLDALCEELGTGPVALVGNSFGGLIAVATAARHPERVERLVLVDAAGLASRYARWVTPRMMQRRSFRLFQRALTRLTTFSAATTAGLMRRPRARGALLRDAVAHPQLLSPAIAAELRAGEGKPAALEVARGIGTFDARAAARRVACPTLVLWGQQDRMVPVAGGHEYAELIAGAQLEVFPDTGHLPMLERPAEFNAALERFLGRPSSA
jgi:pimeloyl-ACP methyl ester carboxylesterase